MNIRNGLLVTRNVARGCLGLAVCAGLLTCLSPSGVDEQKYEITLSLEREGVRTAEFSGEPIKVLVKCTDSVVYDDIVWETGAGKTRRPPDIGIDQKIKETTVEVFWTSSPENLDTIRDLYYDSIFATTGGAIRISNIVEVYVKNLPPVFDSIYIDSVPYSSHDSIVSVKLAPADTDTVSMRVKVIDPDGDHVSIDWAGDKTSLVSDKNQDKPSAFYVPPYGDFRDTVIITMYDGRRGQVIQNVIFYRTSPNSRPVIEQVKINGETLKAGGSVYAYGEVVLDTLYMQVLARDPNNNIDTVIWSAETPGALQWMNADTLELEPLDSLLRMGYVCQAKSCGDSMTDTTVTIDRIKVDVRDSSGATGRINIEIYQGVGYRPATVDSVVVAGELFRGQNTVFALEAFGGDTITMSAHAHDVDTGQIDNITWTGAKEAIFQETEGRTATYVCDSAPYTDTVTLTFGHESNDVQRQVIIDVVSNYPVIDSLVVEPINGTSTKFRGTNRLFEYRTPIDATLTIRVGGHDPDTVGDTLSIRWASKGQELSFFADPFSVGYIAKDSAYIDSLFITLTDSLGAAVTDTLQITVYDTSSKLPVVDSIQIWGATDTVALKSGTPEFTAGPVADDTVVVRVFAYDPQGGKLSYSWASARDSLLLPTEPQTFQAHYRILDSAFNDTVWFTAAGAGTLSVSDTFWVNATDSVTFTTEP